MVGERFHRLSYYYNNAVLYIVKDSMTEVHNTRNDIPDTIQTICDRDYDICFKKALQMHFACQQSPNYFLFCAYFQVLEYGPNLI